MKIVQSVSTCKDCPHRHYYSGGVYECGKVGAAPLPNDCGIPDWCPLPNDAAQIAAQARHALANAKAVLSIATQEAANIETTPSRLRELLVIAADQLALA